MLWLIAPPVDGPSGEILAAEGSRLNRRASPPTMHAGFLNGRRAVRDRAIGPIATGFTLLELLVVMVIIGLLAGYVGPRYFSQIGKSEVKVARAQIDALTKALDAYRLDTRTYPTTEQGLEALMKKPGEMSAWQGPYLQKSVPLDPWGKPYQYRSPGEGRDYEIVSLGRDGKPGGTNEDADIKSWE